MPVIAKKSRIEIPCWIPPTGKESDIASARERRWFWATMPSKTLVAALTLEAIVGTGLTLVGLSGLMPLPWWQTFTILAYTMVACLVVNDTGKVVMIKWLVPMAVAEKPFAYTPRKERS